MTPVVMIWWLLNEKILLKGYLGLCCEENDEGGHLSVKLSLFRCRDQFLEFCMGGFDTFNYKLKGPNLF